MSLDSNASRIHDLDLSRGIAVLGILIMNIQSFSMSSAAYTNPMAYGDMTGINKYIWMWRSLTFGKIQMFLRDKNLSS